MAIIGNNGINISNVVANGVNITTVYVNGVQVWSAGPTNWLFVGTSGGFSHTANYISSYSFCPSSSMTSQEVDGWLTANYPPGNYPTNTVFRVVFYRNNFVPCYNLYYVAV